MSWAARRPCLEHVTDDEGHASHVVPAHASAREIDAQLVGMLEVVRRGPVRVQVDAPEVDVHRSCAASRTTISRAVRPAGKPQLHRLDPLGVLAPARASWKKRLALRAVDVALEHDRPPGDTPERPVGDGRVGLDQVQLRMTDCGKKHLVRVVITTSRPADSRATWRALAMANSVNRRG